MSRVFLDANVLWSAAYRTDAGLRRLWHLDRVKLLISNYALEEARRNCEPGSPHLSRLNRLVGEVEIVKNPPLDSAIEELAALPADDRPILQGAVSSQATHLITGDRRAFGHLFGRSVRGVEILRPADFLARHPDD